MSANPRQDPAPSSLDAGWQVTDMQPEDMSAVDRIERAVYDFPWTSGNFRDSLKSGYRCVVCRDDAKFIGYAVQMYVIDEAHLLNLTIAPAYQRAGNGTRLLRWLMDDARSRKMTSLFLEVRPSNPGAQTLYTRMGFSQVAVRRDYYPAKGGREDALIFKTHL